jgi:mannose-6-phosphate isomerase-like protein (cupin superfamily)
MTSRDVAPTPALRSEVTARVSLADALARLPDAPADQAATVFTHGTLRMLVYAPRGIDPQSPHRQDEVYLVARGSGTFFNGVDRKPFAEGDMLFVPAGMPHRFEEFTDDLALWVVFYGPDGGEAP